MKEPQVSLPLACTNKTQQKLKTSLTVQGWRLETVTVRAFRRRHHNTSFSVPLEATFMLSAHEKNPNTGTNQNHHVGVTCCDV